MRIEGLGKEVVEGRTRVAASFIWEDCNRPNEQVFFETEAPFADDLSCNPHAFLIGAIIPALHYGESRVHMKEPVCPELVVGLNNVMRVLRHWYYPKNRKLVKIEAPLKDELLIPLHKRKSEGFFFSGGIDSFALLCSNRQNFSPTHHRWIKDGLLVYGLELDIPEVFDLVKKSLEKAAAEININLIPVYTNLYLNYRDEDAAEGFSFWINEFGGAALAAVSHVFSSRFRGVSIGGNCDPSNLQPWGSHPMIDPDLSCSELTIRHDCASSRIEKTAMVAAWDPALQHLRVCNQFKRYDKEYLNCGRCEKCIRTMLELLAFDALKKSTAFPVRDVTAAQVERHVKITNPFVLSFYSEVLEPLSHMGRHDLVNAIRKKMDDYRRAERKKVFRKKLFAFDQRHFNSHLSQLFQLIMPEGMP